MDILGEFTTSMIKALDEIDPNWETYPGLIACGSHHVDDAEKIIKKIKVAREQNIPFLGVCFGHQLAVIEYARNVCGLEGAHSAEFDPNSPHLVLDLLPEQKGVNNMGGTMRLGASPVKLLAGSRAHQIYGETLILERHRHRFEVNNSYREMLSAQGLVFSGLSPDGRLVEMIELPNHPFFVASQFHPEFKSRPTRAHPLFREFIRAALCCQSL